ncbi:hypothetical protein JXR93_02010 [bacterium]|nr:hypothetical protein [bacterium]
MSEDKKLSLKERLGQKKTAGIPQTLTKEDFEQKKLEQQRLEEERLKEEERLRKEEEKKRKEEELKKKKEEEARRIREEKERLETERQLKLKEQEVFLKAVSGETKEGEAPKSKLGIILSVVFVLLAFLIGYGLSSIFSGRKVLNEAIVQAGKAFEIIKKSEEVLDKYEQYLRNHKNDKVDLGAGLILGKEGVALLQGDDFTEKFQVYAASIYKVAGKDMIRYANLLMNLINNANRLNIVLDKQTIEILEGVNQQKTLIKLNQESIVTVVNTDYPLPDNKDYIIKMGEMTEFVSVYEDPKPNPKKKKTPFDDKLNVRLIRDTNIEFAIPKVYLTPITDAHKYFETIKPEFVKYETAYRPIKDDWKEIDSMRKRLKQTLEKKSKEAHYFTF